MLNCPQRVTEEIIDAERWKMLERLKDETRKVQEEAQEEAATAKRFAVAMKTPCATCNFIRACKRCCRCTACGASFGENRNYYSSGPGGYTECRYRQIDFNIVCFKQGDHVQACSPWSSIHTEGSIFNTVCRCGGSSFPLFKAQDMIAYLSTFPMKYDEITIDETRGSPVLEKQLQFITELRRVATVTFTEEDNQKVHESVATPDFEDVWKAVYGRIFSGLAAMIQLELEIMNFKKAAKEVDDLKREIERDSEDLEKRLNAARLEHQEKVSRARQVVADQYMINA
jgi:hypothetical protein